MSATKLTITLTDSSTVTVPIAAALQTLDAETSGFSSVDQSVRNIFRAGGFFDGVSTWYPIGQVKSITAS